MAARKQRKLDPLPSDPKPLSQMTDQEMKKRQRQLGSSSSLKKMGDSLKRSCLALFDYQSAASSFLDDTDAMTTHGVREIRKEVEELDIMGPDAGVRHMEAVNERLNIMQMRAERRHDIVGTMSEAKESLREQGRTVLETMKNPCSERQEIGEELKKRRRERKMTK